MRTDLSNTWPETAEGGRLAPTPSVRHKFTPYANPERNKDCARCGKPEADTAHAFLELGQRAAVRAHLDRAGIAASAGDFTEAVREARVAIRLAEED